MKHFLIVAVILFSTIVQADFRSCHIDEYQMWLVNYSYHTGEPYDFGYTLAAIAMQESHLGKYKVNIQDPSGSPWHVTLDKVLRLKQWEDTPFNRNRAMQVLIDNYELGATLAINELLLWERVHGRGYWLKIWASYNGGHRGNAGYARKIQHHIRTIKACKWIQYDTQYADTAFVTGR